MDLQWELEGLEEAAGPRPPSHCEDRLISAHLSFLLRPETREAEQVRRGEGRQRARRLPPTAAAACRPSSPTALHRPSHTPHLPRSPRLLLQLARAVELCSLKHSLRHDGRACSVPTQRLPTHCPRTHKTKTPKTRETLPP